MVPPKCYAESLHWMDAVFSTGKQVDGRFLPDERLRSGSGSRVRTFVAKDERRGGNPVVMKVARMDDPVCAPLLEDRFRHLDGLADFRYLVRPVDLIDFTQAGMRFRCLVEAYAGATLSLAISDLSLDEKLSLFKKVCRSLAALHQSGKQHLNLKPSNILIETREGLEEPVIRLDDCFVDPKSLLNYWRAFGSRQLATVARMAPEFVDAARPNEIGVRADIYQLGLLLFELIDGNLPFEDTDVAELIRKHREIAPPELVNAPESLKDVVGRCLAKKPEERFQNVEELLEALGDASFAPATRQAKPKRNDATHLEFWNAAVKQLKAKLPPNDDGREAFVQFSEHAGLIVTFRRLPDGSSVDAVTLLIQPQRDASEGHNPIARVNWKCDQPFQLSSPELFDWASGANVAAWILEAFDESNSPVLDPKPVVSTQTLDQAYREVEALKRRCSWITFIKKTSNNQRFIVTIMSGNSRYTLQVKSTPTGLTVSWANNLGSPPFSLDHDEFDSIAQWLECQHTTIS